MGSIPFLKFFCLLVMGEERLTLGAKWELANSAFLDSGAGVMEFPSLHQVQALPATSSRLLAHHNLLPRALCMQAYRPFCCPQHHCFIAGVEQWEGPSPETGGHVVLA